MKKPIWTSTVPRRTGWYWTRKGRWSHGKRVYGRSLPCELLNRAASGSQYRRYGEHWKWATDAKLNGIEWWTEPIDVAQSRWKEPKP